MTKVDECARLLMTRIEEGDLLLKGRLPSERRLVDETGMSRTTIRKALKQLFDEGVLVREGRGRAQVAENGSSRQKRPVVAFLVPVMFSGDHTMWWDAVMTVFEGQDVILRPLTYVHLEDPVIHETITAYDGVFLVPPAENLPRWLAGKMRDAPSRIVVLDQDATRLGFVSVELFPPAAEKKLLDHLVEQGHKRIDCINSQPDDDVILGRIAGWEKYIEDKKLAGVLRSQPDGKPLPAAYELVGRLLREGHLLGTALFCTTGPCAIGTMRALREAGLVIGRDVSVCAVNDEGIGRYLLKTLTALESRARPLYLRKAAEWMLSDAEWEGDLLIRPQDAPLFVGESTGPAPAGGSLTVSAVL